MNKKNFLKIKNIKTKISSLKFQDFCMKLKIIKNPQKYTKTLLCAFDLRKNLISRRYLMHGVNYCRRNWMPV